MKIEKEKKKEKQKQNKNKTKTNRIAILLYSTFVEFLLFYTIPLSVETVSPIRTSIAVCLIVSFTVNAFEEMRLRIIFSYGKP